MSVGQQFAIVDRDQGDGWTQVRASDGAIGFVPTSYVKINDWISSIFIVYIAEILPIHIKCLLYPMTVYAMQLLYIICSSVLSTGALSVEPDATCRVAMYMIGGYWMFLSFFRNQRACWFCCEFKASFDLIFHSYWVFLPWWLLILPESSYFVTFSKYLWF